MMNKYKKDKEYRMWIMEMIRESMDVLIKQCIFEEISAEIFPGYVALLLVSQKKWIKTEYSEKMQTLKIQGMTILWKNGIFWKN